MICLACEVVLKTKLLMKSEKMHPFIIQHINVFCTHSFILWQNLYGYCCVIRVLLAHICADLDGVAFFFDPTLSFLLIIRMFYHRGFLKIAFN